MVQVSNTTTHTGARRRSQRVLMQVPVRIRGKNAQGAEFEEFTETLAINAHGSLILLNARLTSGAKVFMRSEEHTSELQSQSNLVCRLLLEKKKHRKRPPHHCKSHTFNAAKHRV